MQRLLLEIGPERRLLAFVYALHAAALALSIFMSWPPAVRPILMLWAGLSLLNVWIRSRRRTYRTLVMTRNGPDVRWNVRTGAQRTPQTLFASFVSSHCVLLQVGDGCWRRELICITRRNCDGDMFRRLRVALRA